MLKLTAPVQIHLFTIIYGTRIHKISTRIQTTLTRIRNYFIQNARIRSPALVQNMKRYLKNLEEWLLLLGTVRYLIKTRGSGFIGTVQMIRYGTVISFSVLNFNKDTYVKGHKNSVDKINFKIFFYFFYHKSIRYYQSATVPINKSVF